MVLNDLLTGGKEVSKWLKDNEQPLTLLGILIGTITTAVIAYTIAQNAAAIATGIATAATTLATAATSAFGVAMAFVTVGCDTNGDGSEEQPKTEANTDEQTKNTVLGKGQTKFLFTVVDKEGATYSFKVSK